MGRLAIRFRFLVASSLIVGAFIGSMGVVSALSSNSTVTICANKSGELRYAKDGICKTAKETALILGETGPQGPEGPEGPAGPQGPIGQTGAAGARGPAGKAFVQLYICGASGLSICEVGSVGPGGGIVVWVDTNSTEPDYDFIEASTTDLSTSLPWATSTQQCGGSSSGACDSNFLYSFAEDLKLKGSFGEASGKIASDAIIGRHDAGSVARDSYAAGAASEFCTTDACDWFLPSFMQLIWTYKSLKGTANALVPDGYYWTSTPWPGIGVSHSPTYAMNVKATGEAGGIFMSSKAVSLNVRVVRTF